MYQKIAFAIACIVSGLAFVGCGGPAPVLAPVYQHLAEPIVTGSFVVEPRTFKPFKVVVANGMTKPRLEGTFSASGARNDIEVTLLDESQLATWQNRGRVEPAYASGRVTNATMNIELPPDPATYYVVFSNRFSLISNKAVTADLHLRYDRLDVSADSGSRRRGAYRRR
jgi:hypothetical protein